MKSFLLIAALFQILSGSSTVSAFQSAPPAVQPSLFHQRQAVLFRQQSIAEPCRKPQLLASTVLVEEAADVVMDYNPWERVCSTVQTTTSQLNALRQKVAKSGVATAISYSLVSNAFTSVAVSLAWYGFSMQSGLSPISPGQWKPFLAWYGGFYAINSLLKPVRFFIAFSLVVPHTERLMAGLQAHFDDSKKAAIACSTALLLVSSGMMMAGGIGLASLISGVPIFPAASIAL